MFTTLSKKLLRSLFGRNARLDDWNNYARTTTVNYTTGNNTYSNKKFTYRTDDGLVPTLLEKLEDMEYKISNMQHQLDNPKKYK